MNIKFIGTGSGLASLKRNHSSFIINSGDYNLLVDCGDGTAKALLSQNISFNELNGIIISHLHPDHFAGLPALLVQMKLSDRVKELDIFINQALVEFVKKFLMQSYIFIDRMGFDINFRIFVDDEKTEVTGNLSFFSRQNSHLEKYKNFDSKNIIKFSCSGFLFKEGNERVFYTGDIGVKEDLDLFEDHNFVAMISEVSHVKYEDILNAFIKQKAGKLILTHIDDENLEEIKSFFLSRKKEEGKDIILAYDGMTYSTNF